MPIHDWTKVDAGIFHSFHLSWIAELNKALNRGILPKGYYALAEQHAGERTLAIRHVSENRLVALIEIVSPANKDRRQSVTAFVNKIEEVLQFGIHALVLDLFPPSKHDPCGMHGAIWQRLENTEALYDLPADDLLTLASYARGKQIDVYLEHPAVGEKMADMPLFLRSNWYVYVPLETTYQEAFRSLPEIYREELKLPNDTTN